MHDCICLVSSTVDNNIKRKVGQCMPKIPKYSFPSFLKFTYKYEYPNNNNVFVCCEKAFWLFCLR